MSEETGNSSQDAIKDHPLAQQYNALTPESVIEAVEARGRRCTGRFLILNSYENRVYQLELDDDTWVVGKFYRPGRWSLETIQEEHTFIGELHEEEIPVAVPMDLGDGRTVGEVGGIYYSLFPRVGGRAPQELNDEQTKMLGRLVARIHNVGSRWDAPNRLRLTPKTYGEDNLAYLLDNKTIPAEAEEIYAATVKALIARMEPLFLGVPTHRLHGDCHLANLVDTPAGYTFLDFDDMVVGPAAQDLWMIVPSADDYGKRQRDLFLEAYAEFRSFDPAWLKLVEPLRALRFVHYSTWIARRWADPTFKRTFGYFGTLQYWQKEIQDLREQIARMDQADQGYWG